MKTDLLYEMIFKRKSFYLFREKQGEISREEINSVYDFFSQADPLVSDIKTDMRIVPANETTCNRGEEYCILLYSECKENYLQNIGYIGEQIDLFLASKNIGALWFGIGKTEEKSYNGLDFVIMIAIAKMPEEKFRKDMFKAKRKSLDEIWVGDIPAYADILRFAPSACNTQPWIVEKRRTLYVFIATKSRGKEVSCRQTESSFIIGLIWVFSCLFWISVLPMTGSNWKENFRLMMLMTMKKKYW